eukprot:6430839-Prymnesium_polylepis.1
MAFACETENDPLVMKLLFAGYDRESAPQTRQEQPTAAGAGQPTSSDARDAAQYANRAVGKARTLYQMLSRRYALDAEQRRKGAAGLTEPERVQLEMRIKDARVRLARLGHPPPTVCTVLNLRKIKPGAQGRPVGPPCPAVGCGLTCETSDVVQP